MTRTPATPRWPIDEVLARTDLGALLDEFAQPDQRARRWHCPLADHDDSHASVTMHRDHRGHERWRCWSGDDRHRGDAVDLIQAVRGCPRIEAIDELATRAGMHPDRDLPPIPTKRPVGPPPATELDERVIGYAKVCGRLLWTPLGAPVREWLRARGLHDDVLQANHVGADPGRERLRRAGGLPYGAGVGATFPALDTTGQIRYVQTRALDPQPGRGKYDNPSAALAPNPRLTWTNPSGAVHAGQLVVCEGIPDALIAAQAGYRSVGLLGTNALDPAVAVRIANIANRDHLDVIVIVDVDDNGIGKHLGEHLATQLAGLECPARVIEPPDGHDLTTWALDNPTWHTTLAPSVAHDATQLQRPELGYPLVSR
jgi:hypothetical protein